MIEVSFLSLLVGLSRYSAQKKKAELDNKKVSKYRRPFRKKDIENFKRAHSTRLPHAMHSQ